MSEKFPMKSSKCDTVMTPANSFKRDNSKLFKKAKG